MEALSKRLKKARENTGLSQQSVSYLSGVPQSVLSKAEAGRITPCVRNLVKLCRILNVSSDWLLGLSDEVQSHTLHR